jgi:hypothetical protein
MPCGSSFRTGFQFTDLTKDCRATLREMANLYSRGVPVKVSIS